MMYTYFLLELQPFLRRHACALRLPLVLPFEHFVPETAALFDQTEHFIYSFAIFVVRETQLCFVDLEICFIRDDLSHTYLGIQKTKDWVRRILTKHLPKLCSWPVTQLNRLTTPAIFKQKCTAIMGSVCLPQMLAGISIDEQFGEVWDNERLFLGVQTDIQQTGDQFCCWPVNWSIH